MESKKNPKVDLNRQWWLFFFVGMCISLGGILMAFEWESKDDLETMNLGELEDEDIVMEDIPITEMPPPPPPVLQQPEIIEVPEEEEIEEQIEMELDVEVEEETVPDVPVKIDAPPPPPPVEEKEEEIFLVVEDMPQYEGGMAAFYKYVAKNMKYPKQARRMGVEGRVIIQMVVQKDGTLGDFKVLKGVGSGCDEEALRVLKNSPKWKPGKQRGKAVTVKMTVPIIFRLK